MSAPDLSMTPRAEPTRRGEVFDRGYQHYDGERLGRKHAFTALVRYSMKRALGIKKGWGSKIIPIIVYVAVLIPVIISIGIKGFLSNANIISYNAMFGLIFALEGIFVATIAPEMLCGDRRENVLSLYFSRAITRLDYLLAKLCAAAILTLTVSLVPVAFYWLGLQLLADHPLAAFKDNIGDLGKIAIAGVLIAVYLGALGLMISSFTGRKSIAVAIIIIGFIAISALAVALYFALDGKSYRHDVLFLSPADTVRGLVQQLFEPIRANRRQRDEQIIFSVWTYGGAMVATVVVALGVMFWRYVPED
jgi:ABC-2 type transport system permease protein